MTDACGAVEFAGPFVDARSMDMRFTLCNMGIELGTVAAYMQPDGTTLDWVKKRTRRRCTKRTGSPPISCV